MSNSEFNPFTGTLDRVKDISISITSATQYDILQYDGTNWVNKQDIDVLGTGNINLKSGQKIYFDA